MGKIEGDNLGPREVLQRYGKTLVDYVAKLKKGGLTAQEVRKIYQTAAKNLKRLNEHTTARDKVRIICLAAMEALGSTRFQIVTTQANLQQETRFRIEETLE